MSSILTDGRRVLRLAQRSVHPGGVLSCGVPVRPLPGSAQLSRQLRHLGHRHRPTVLRVDLQPRVEAEATLTIFAAAPGAAAVHRLADLLRLRGRPRPPEQEDRHQALIGPVPPARTACYAAGFFGHPQPDSKPHHGGAVRATRRRGHERDAASPGGSGRSGRCRPGSANPLWFYVLREADVTPAGQHLGPIGGRIVAEVITGLIDGDPSSYLSLEPDWTPTYGSNATFVMTDLLAAAGVVGVCDHKWLRPEARRGFRVVQVDASQGRRGSDTGVVPRPRRTRRGAAWAARAPTNFRA